jgi:hypothetical protein
MRNSRQGEVFAWYFRALAGLQSIPEKLQEWDRPYRGERPPGAPFGLVVESRARRVSPSTWKNADAVRKTLPGVQRSAALDLMLRDGVDGPVKLPAPLLPPEMRVHCVSPSDLEAIFSDEGDLEDHWQTFYERYPNTIGFAGFSAVGFSADGSQAVFVFERNCGSLCGTGFGVQMRQTGLGWAIEDHRMLWIS